MHLTRRRVAGAIAMAGLLALGATPALAATIEGTWVAQGGAEITIAPCPTGYCGTLSWIVIPPEQTELCRSLPSELFAPLVLDYRNPDRSQQTRALIGAEVLRLKPAGNRFEARVYNALDGQTHDVTMWVEGDVLKLGAGCVMGICAFTQDWPRAAERGDAPGYSCDGSPSPS
jgi:uncharacterized protein (DUF2147 family)